jgi:Holliday junction DNA helicase RuvA
MIAFLTGTVFSKVESACYVDVQGVGYEVSLPASEWERLPAVGEAVTLYTWYLGREDGVQLFGFLSWESRQLFKLLLSVNGVGPKSALAVLSGLSKPELEQAVARQDVGAFSRLPGIGRKTAERLLLELKDKVKVTPQEPGGHQPGLQSDAAQALEALEALGYPASRARTALQKAMEEAPPVPGMDRVAHWVRQALKYI